MSLVQAVITKDFILVGADKRGIQPDGSILENCNKIIKLNSGIIFGCTGGILDNFKLFSGYCYYSEELGLVNSEDIYDVSYNNFVDIISNRFQEMYKEHIDENNPRHYDIGSMICGFNGNEFEVTTFNIGGVNGAVDGIYKVTKSPDFPYKGVNAGKIIHRDVLHKMVGEFYFKYGELTIRQYKNIMLDVFEEGARIDETINDIVCFEKIRRKDVVL